MSGDLLGKVCSLGFKNELGVGIDCYVIGGAGLQDRGRFTSTYGLEPDGAVLVRPDGHVAWRHTTGPADGAAFVETLRSILAR
jgi:putative polyketide hydroxylase